MLADLFKALRDHFTQQESVIPVRLQWVEDGRARVYWDPNKKEVVEFPMLRPGNRHVLKSYASLCKYVNETGANGLGTKEDRRIVWVGDKEVVVEMGENDDLDVVKMPIEYSDAWNTLAWLSDSPLLTQFDAVRLLRQQFNGCDGALKALTAIQSLRLQKTEGFESEQSHDVSRVGKSVLQQATGGAELPEWIVVDTEVFAGIAEQDVRPIKVWLSVDFESRKIRFEPDTTVMKEAIRNERKSLLVKMAADMPKASVYEGAYRVAS